MTVLFQPSVRQKKRFDSFYISGCVTHFTGCPNLTFIITIYVREGIVLASDSRITLNLTTQQEGHPIQQLAVGQSDSTYKTFVTPKSIGISTFGDADIQGVPITGYIESFINDHLSKGNYDVEQVPQELVNYFGKLPGPPNVGFLVVGYKKVNNIPEQHIWEAIIPRKNVERLNQAGVQGASWRGETDILSRLIQPVFFKDQQNNYQQLPHYQIEWGFFTLQDAIDYCMYAVKMTIDTLRFQARPKTVGGLIDVLVIKPNEAFWVQRKALHV